MIFTFEYYSNILILHYASMQFEIDETDSLKICIAKLEVENDKIAIYFFN